MCMLCPVDNVVCDSHTLEDISLSVCPRCHGIWVEKDAMTRLVRLLSSLEEGQEEFLQKWSEIDEDGHTLPKDFWQETHIRCPNHPVQLQKHYFPGTMIGLDHCLVCGGFWIEGPEVLAIAQYVQHDPHQDMLGRALAERAGEKLNAAYQQSGQRTATTNPLTGKEDIFGFLLRAVFSFMRSR